MASIINATTTNGVAVQGDNSGSLQLQTNNGTTAVTIDTSQNVGIGTTAPSSKLNVQSASGNYATFSTSGTNKLFVGVDNGTPELVVGASAGDAVIRTQQQLWFGLSGGGVAGRFDSSGNFYMNSGYGSAATAYGCRAWVYFDPSGSILASGNVSSVSKNSTGNYTVSFTNAMPSSNYSAVATCDIGGWNAGNTQTGGYNTGSISIQTRNTSMTATDASVSLAIFR